MIWMAIGRSRSQRTYELIGMPYLILSKELPATVFIFVPRHRMQRSSAERNIARE
jgi:hypothetical protein